MTKNRGISRRATIIVYLLALTSIVLLGIYLRSSRRGEYQSREIRGAAGLFHNKVVHQVAGNESTISGRIEHVVALPDGEFLLIVSRSPGGDDKFVASIAQGHCYLQIAASKRLVVATIVENSPGDGGRRMIRCRASEQQHPLQQSRDEIDAAVVRSRDKITLTNRAAMEVVDWNNLVFASLPRDGDLVLFTKGIFPVKEKIPRDGARCVFYTADGGAAVYTRLLGIAQEIIRCEYPPVHRRSSLLGNRVSVTSGDGEGGDVAAPSVALYTEAEPVAAPPPPHFLCACTMIHNAAKFLREWAIYHSHIGIEKFVLYNNNSEDSIEETVAALAIAHGLEIDVVPWPWIKTQEAGFAHCAAARRRECQWMAFLDVDEFVFPKNWLYNSPPSTHTVRSPPLARAIAAVANRNASQMVGQISLHCRNFGPSGLKQHPQAGVTQGYTCRMLREQRHKSLVLLDAVHPGLVNVVHHFALGQRYKTVTLPPPKGVINHYKFQAWDEFQHKFERRVSAYVSDWKEAKNIKSQDRTPGLGNKPEKPADWERQFCQIQDTALRDYIVETIASPDMDLPWHRATL